jgi:hypothetical protein
MKKFSALLHPFLLTLGSMLFLYFQAWVMVPPDQVIRPVLFMWLILGLLAWPAFLIARDWYWAGILLTAVSIGLFFAHLFLLFVGLTVIPLIILFSIISLFRKRKVSIVQIAFLINVMSGVAILLEVVYAFQVFSRVPSSYYRTDLQQQQWVDAAAAVSKTTHKPDIYYIVLDAYARQDVLQEIYGFDNGEFINFLRTEGFIVPVNSRSNYPRTALSISTSLNMDYLHEIAPGANDSYFWWLMSPLIHNSRARTLLEAGGYQTVALSTDWGITDLTDSDVYLHPYPVMLTDFERHTLATTPLKGFSRFIGSISPIPTMETHRRIILFNFEQLARVPAIPGPKFVFAHIVSPHPPFVFDRTGKPLDPNYGFTFNDGFNVESDLTSVREQYRQSYNGQVEFVNSRLRELITRILADSETPPIIILQADHGPGMLVDFSSVEKTCLQERYSIFAAFYLPGFDGREVPTDITPVNLFRLIFNEYFSTDLPMLENSFYFPKDTVRIYNLEDISRHIDSDSHCEIH